MMIHMVSLWMYGDIDRVFSNIEDAAEYMKNVPQDWARPVILTTFVEGVTDEVWVSTRSTKFDTVDHIVGIHASQDEAIRAWSEMEENCPMGDDDIGGFECFKIDN